MKNVYSLISSCAIQFVDPTLWRFVWTCSIPMQIYFPRSLMSALVALSQREQEEEKVLLPLLKANIAEILKKVKNRLTTRKNLRTGYQFNFALFFHFELVQLLFRLTRDYRTPHGKKLEVGVACHYNRQEVIKGYDISLFSLKAFHTIFSLFLNKTTPITKFTEKKVGGQSIHLRISPDKPFTIKYSKNVYS